MNPIRELKTAWMTQKELADKLGVSRHHLRMVERGDRQSAPVIGKAAALLRQLRETIGSRRR